jgi:hypothetical protein
MGESKDFGLVFWLHLAIIIFIFSSPFLFSWKLILAGVILYYIQVWIFGTCVLALWEFSSEDGSFFAHYLPKIGINLSRKKIFLLTDYLATWGIFAFAIFWQVILNHSVIVPAPF